MSKSRIYQKALRRRAHTMSNLREENKRLITVVRMLMDELDDYKRSAHLAKPLRPHKLEHSEEVLVGTHKPDHCLLEHCVIHNMSNHLMRSFPQHWRADRRIMERICPHGVGHPDPDDIKTKNTYEFVHGCDGCCRGAYDFMDQA